MKLIHTADLHLRKGEEKKLDILRWLVQKSNELKADAFIIAGDLFDSDTDATILRPIVKGIFNGSKARFLLINGNHDQKSYSPDYDYGKNAIQFVQKPFELHEFEGTRICGIPYQDAKFSDCIKELPDRIDILISHGTLYDKSYIFSVLDDDESKYLPIFPANLENIARYVALGHMHARNFETVYKNTKVVYPGSPLPLDTKCQERRVFYEIEIDKSKITTKPVQVDIAPYWLDKEYIIFPGAENYIWMSIETDLKALIDKLVMPYVLLKGFTGITERQLADRTAKLKADFEGKFIDIRIDCNHIRSWDRIIEDPTVKKFIRKTEGIDRELRMKIFEIVLPVFSDTIE